MSLPTTLTPESVKLRSQSCVSGLRASIELIRGQKVDKEVASHKKLGKVQVYVQHTSESKVHRVVTRGKIMAPSFEVAIKALFDAETRSRWDKEQKGLRILTEYEPFDNFRFVRSTNMKVEPPAMTMRDFYSLQTLSVYENPGVNEAICAAISLTTDSSCPEVKNIIRAEIVTPSGWLLRSTSQPDIFDLYYVLHSDLKGKVPTAIVNAAITTAIADFYTPLRDFLAKHAVLQP